MITYLDALNSELDDLLANHQEIVLLGEDIREPYGGAFKVTKGLSEKYPERVINTPISEAALTGVVAGAAMRGMRPVLEIMFGDFITLCADQLVNHASKFRWMYNDKVSVPMVIRTPMGGRRGYGPTHSQTLEKLYMGIPGLKIVAPSHFHRIRSLLKNSVLADNPTLFIENKLMYPREIKRSDNGYLGDFAVKTQEAEFPTLYLSNYDFNKADITLVAYGGMLPITTQAATEALQKAGVASEIIVPSLLQPIEGIELIANSIEKSGKAILCEEGTLTNGWGAEIATRIQEEAFTSLEAPVKRVAAKNIPIGCSETIENRTLPQMEDIFNAILETAK